MIAVAERIAGQAHRIETWRCELEAVPDWVPTRGLLAACADAARRLRDIEQAAERPLVVVILGGCGVGKSTLLNALAHQHGLSATGPARPTTNEVVAYAARRDDAALLEDAVGRMNMRVVTNAEAAGLGRLVLVDTPDTNSVAAVVHRPLVERALAVADVLLCLFSAADNPKAADQLAYLSPFVAAFPKEYLYVGLTQVDRLTADERRTVADDFQKHLAKAWSRCPKATYALAAKAREANVAADDDFDSLENELRVVLGRIESPMTVRAMRAEAVGDDLERRIRNALDCAKAPASLATQLLGQCALRQRERLRVWLARPVDGAALADEVARRSKGPVGGLLRLSRWLARRGARFAGWRRRTRDAATVVGDPLGGLRLEVARAWPDIAARLREAGFSAEAVADPLERECVARVEAETGGVASVVAAQAHDFVVAWLTRRWMQVLLNLLLLAIPVAGLCQGLWTVFVVRQSALPAGYLGSVAGLWALWSLLLLGGVCWIRGIVHGMAWRRAVRRNVGHAGQGLVCSVPVVRQLRALFDLTPGGDAGSSSAPPQD